jgi:hypothetical protein
MRPRRVRTLAVLIILLVLSATVASALAADYGQVGVREGDSADYLTSSTVYPYNLTTKYHVYYYSVAGTYVIINGFYLFPNGTVQGTESVAGDVSVGQNLIYLNAICSNLAAGDPIYSNATWKINETITMNILGKPRLVNHANFLLVGAPYNVYWDKATGLMVAQQAHLTPTSWINYTLTSTTAFTDVTILVYITIGSFVAIFVVAVVALRRRKR